MFNHILVATDLSNASDEVVCTLGTHVIQPGAAPELRGLVESRLQLLRDDLLRLGAASVRVEVLDGSAKQEVLARTQSGAYTLVIVGSQGKGYIPGAVLGSVSHAVAYMARTPVLFVPLRA